MKDGLEQYYAGDAEWNSFSDLFMDELSDSAHDVALLAAVGDERIAAVIAGSLRDSSMKWLDESVPALGDETPKACLRTPKGRMRLKEMLMRMPR